MRRIQLVPALLAMVIGPPAGTLVVLGLTLNPINLRASALLGFAAMPVVNGSSQAIRQSKTAPEVQGRVFYFRRASSYSSIPLAYLLAGPLAESGTWVGGLGRLNGVGSGRGIGVPFIVLGLATLVATAIALA